MVITNRGGAYDSNTGIFTCPSPGAYVFTWSSMSGRDSEECAVYIVHNGVKLMESDSDNEGNHQYEVASNTITLVLVKGDRVWIQTTHGNNCMGYPYTGFSGWKI
ncbi:hypothetical protein FSP39_016358 [Pinctada imbricata]|uniref:C1q domain-containing protein n=1 Tax=Pinctada imbricata TaxID=66713 RepID=A0AA88YTM4_PINIB|nr:hypothetical protein FSP39_016358 [Pinctada imbricata]